MSQKNIQRSQRISYSIGSELEKRATYQLHNKYCPLIISSLLLRSIKAGQVDCAVVLKDHIQLIEIKNQIAYLGAKQRSRLRLTQKLVAFIFNRPAILKEVDRVSLPNCW